MTLEQLLRNHQDDEQIVNRLIELYPDMAQSTDGFYKILPELRQKTPTKAKMLIVVKPEYDDYDKCEYIHVCGELINPVEDDDFTLFALDFTPWDEWLGMRIHPSSLQAYSGLDILAHVLWELTWHGFDEAEQQAEAEALHQKVKEMQAVEDLINGKTPDSQ